MLVVVIMSFCICVGFKWSRKRKCWDQIRKKKMKNEFSSSMRVLYEHNPIVYSLWYDLGEKYFVINVPMNMLPGPLSRGGHIIL